MRLKDVLKYELIGLTVEIIQSTNPSLKGLRGKVIDETRNTLTLYTDGKEKKIIKKQATIMVTFHNKKIAIEGNLLIARPEDRLKKKIKI